LEEYEKAKAENLISFLKDDKVNLILGIGSAPKSLLDRINKSSITILDVRFLKTFLNLVPESELQ
jgi:hypothetical protein